MLYLLTGGSGCGKSTFAEALCLHLPGPRTYIAAMREPGERDVRHRAACREKGFLILERFTDLAGLRLPRRGGTAMLECICNLTANEMFQADGAMSDPFDRVMSGVDALCRQCGNVVLVTNEIGSDGGGYPASTAAYISVIGRLNAALADRADTVAELVCAIPLIRKGTLPAQTEAWI